MSFEQVNPATTSDSTDGHPQGAQDGASVVFVGATGDSNVLNIDFGNGAFASSGPHPIVRSTGEFVTDSPEVFDLEDPELWSIFENSAFLSLLYGDNESVSVSNQEFQTPTHVVSSGVDTVVDLDSAQMHLHKEAFETPTCMVPTRLFGPDTEVKPYQVQVESEFDPDSFSLDDFGDFFDSPHGVCNMENQNLNEDDNGSLVFSDDDNDDNDFPLEGLSLLAPDVTCGNVDCVVQGICSCGVIPFSPITTNFASVCACDDCCDGNYCASWTGCDVRASKSDTDVQHDGIELQPLDLQFDHFEPMQPEQPEQPEVPVIPEPAVQRTRGHPKRAKLTDATITVSSSLDAQEVTVSFDDKVVDLDNADRDARRASKSEARRAEKLERVYYVYCPTTRMHVAICSCSNCGKQRG